jgi:hypothetical protein
MSTTCLYPNSSILSNITGIISKNNNINPVKYDPAVVAMYNNSKRDWDNNLSNWNNGCNNSCSNKFTTSQHSIGYLCFGDAGFSSDSYNYPKKLNSGFNSSTLTCQCVNGSSWDGLYCQDGNGCNPSCGVFQSGGYCCRNKGGNSSCDNINTNKCWRNIDCNTNNTTNCNNCYNIMGTA